MRVEALDPVAAQRLDQAGVERARHRHRLRGTLGLAALGDDPPVAPRRVDRDRPRGLQQALSHRWLRCRYRQRAIRGDPRHTHRLQRAAVVDAQHVGAGPHRQRHRRDRPPLALARRQPLLPRAGEHGADEVLARERDVQRQPQLAQLAEPAQHLQVLLDGQVEVEPRVDRDLLHLHSKPPGRLDSPPQPRLKVVDDVAVGARGPVDPRRALDVHQHVAAAPLGDQLEHLLRAAGDVVDRDRAGVERPPRHLDREGVGGHRHARARQARDRRDQRRRLVLGLRPAARFAPPPRRRRACRTPPRQAPARRRSPAPAVPLRAPSNIESTVTLTIPAASGCARSSVRSASRHGIRLP